ncbi:hypothetical protein KSS87_009163 [Heliosperma pusillum]|nr:hypothetical protein KSS87_009163 [Heliosperma pusillum]
MADVALSVAQTLFAALQSSELKEIFSIWGYKSQLKELEEIVLTIRKVLVDIDDKEYRLYKEEAEFIVKLNNSVYDADDLFDEVLTLAELKKHDKNGKLSKKVRDFFSPKNPINLAYTMSREIKRIRKRLDEIVGNHTKFGFKFDVEPIRKRGEETCSYVYAPDVVGRKDDVEVVLNKILDLSVEGNIGFVSIVGVGGLGKTTLAQLVYNDEMVKCEFSLRLWVCVSDQGGKEFDVKSILSRILESAGYELGDGLSKERVQTRFQEEFGGKKCLLVLDDVWNEDCYKWRELRDFLRRFGRGSRIIITSRSKESARIIGNDDSYIYELGGLSEENSWCLFELTAFGKGHGHVGQTELMEIGRNIVKHCRNVPLAIKVVGSLLFGQPKSKWQAFEEDGLACLANTSPGGSMITSILKLSYDHLHSPLKMCFRYCAVFQKGFRIRKEMLISLWMAQGYVKPFYEGQDMEEAADEQFSILLRRCFFQDVRMDEYGDVKSCKVHDLMHDLAQQVAGDEVCAASSMGNDLGGSKMRHLYEDREHYEEGVFGKSKIRSYLQLYESIYDSNLDSETMMKPLVENWVCLRTLTLHHSSVKVLPDAIGKLIHIRNLDLRSSRELLALPNSVTRLYNLQTLILANCESLKELPKDFSKLVNIRHLDIRGCRRFTNMPIGFHKLVCLTVLTAFYVGMTGSSDSVGQLKDLLHLKNLKGDIEFIIPKIYSSIEERNQEGDILAKTEHLKSIQIRFKSRLGAYGEDKRDVEHEYLIKKLQPHPNLKGFELRGYQGQTIPIWGNAGLNWVMFLPNLVKIQLENCSQLKELPLLCELEHLRSLELSCLYNVEYMEEYPTNSISSNGVIFFLSLEYLNLHGMLMLKGWWKQKQDESWLASFPRLSKLKILQCPNLIAFPSSPTVETLELREVNERLKLITQATSSPNSKVKHVQISHVADLRALPPCHPTSISIYAAWAETFSEASDVFKTRGSTSLRHLQIEYCGRLKSLSGGGFEHLTVLESLEISYCRELSLNDADNGNPVPWRLFGRNLRSIKLSNLKNMRSLPIGMQDLRSLRHLTIEFCENFGGLPEWIGKLASLESLVVLCCGEIKSLPEAMESLTSLCSLGINPCSKELLSRCLNRAVPVDNKGEYAQRILSNASRKVGILHWPFVPKLVNSMPTDSPSLHKLDNFCFETIPDGLPPDNKRGINDLPALLGSLFSLESKKALRSLLLKLRGSSDVPPITCMIVDAHLNITHELSKELDIPVLLFYTTSACAVLGFLHFDDLDKRGLFPLKDESYLTNGFLDMPIDWIPGLKNGIKLKHLPSFLRTTDPHDFMFNYNIEAASQAIIAGNLILNTFDDLDSEVLQGITTKIPNIFTVGPLPLLSHQANLQNLGSNLWKEDTSCLEWLDKRSPKSVIYVNYGSLTILTSEQLEEFAWGLANSKQHFLWVIRNDLVNDESVILSKEYMEEIKGTGLISGWCPQEKVLKHPAIGAFLTHCGWNSTLESMCEGLPMICWPFFADQQTNCYYACDDWGVGVEIGDGEVKRGKVEEAVREVMEGEKGVEMRKKALEWKKKAEEATTFGGSSCNNFEDLVKWITHKNNR